MPGKHERLLLSWKHRWLLSILPLLLLLLLPLLPLLLLCILWVLRLLPVLLSLRRRELTVRSPQGSGPQRPKRLLGQTQIFLINSFIGIRSIVSSCSCSIGACAATLLLLILTIDNIGPLHFGQRHTTLLIHHVGRRRRRHRLRLLRQLLNRPFRHRLRRLGLQRRRLLTHLHHQHDGNHDQHRRLGIDARQSLF